MVDQREALGTSWHDSNWIPRLNANNVMDYFSERSNPFYDRTCNNEVIKMQGLSSNQLHNMVGLEYTLLHVQEPILYVIRKEHRHSPSQVTPLADYYIIAGRVYQVPDLCAIVNSRLTAVFCHLQEAFEEARSYSRYSPSSGYSFQFKSSKSSTEELRKKAKPTENEPASMFQTQRVDTILAELVKKFPPKLPNQPQPIVSIEPSVKVENNKSSASGTPQASDIKTKPPPEKKPRLA